MTPPRLAAWASCALRHAGFLDITRRAGSVCLPLRAALSRQATSLPSPSQHTAAGKQNQ
nr:hypothetical protein [Dyella sp. ASV24]